MRANGERRPATVYDYVFRGDHILLAGQGTKVGLRYRRQAGITTIGSDAQSDLDFASDRGAALGRQLTRILARLSYWWTGERHAIGQANIARDPTARSDNASPPGPLTAALSPTQYLTPDRAMIVPVWRGAAARIVLSGSGGEPLYRWLILNKRATRLNLDPGLEGATIDILDAENHAVRITLVRSHQQPKLPDWIGALRDRDEAQLATASWLALDGPPKWRLEGISRLASLAEENLTARTVWEAFLFQIADGSTHSSDRTR